MADDTYTPPPNGWTCFHCGDTFTATKAAREHFSKVPHLPPECIDAASPARKLARRARLAERRVMSTEREHENLLHQHLALAEEMRQLRRMLNASRFGSTVQAADDLVGRVLAAEAVVEYIAKRFPNIVQKARQSV